MSILTKYDLFVRELLEIKKHKNNDDLDEFIKKFIKENPELDIHEYLIKYTCGHGDIEFLKYLCKKEILKKQDMLLCECLSIRLASQRGHLDIIKYIVKEFDFGKKEFIINDNYCLRWSLQFNYIDVVKYLHKKIGLNKSDFTFKNKSVINWLYVNEYKELINYLKDNKLID